MQAKQVEVGQTFRIGDTIYKRVALRTSIVAPTPVAYVFALQLGDNFVTTIHPDNSVELLPVAVCNSTVFTDPQIEQFGCTFRKRYPAAMRKLLAEQVKAALIDAFVLEMLESATCEAGIRYSPRSIKRLHSRVSAELSDFYVTPRDLPEFDAQ